MRKEISFEKYDTLSERFDQSSFKCDSWWPTVAEIKENVEPKVEQHLEFLIWITETANEPVTAEQIESRTYINNLINKTLIFTD